MNNISSLKENITQKKKLFQQYRISNGVVSKQNIKNKEATTKVEPTNINTTPEVQKTSITQKMKNVLFGKKN